MKNEQGLTLIELLAVLAITGIIAVLIASIMATGTNSSERTTTRQKLQQEGNYIVEVIRQSYLENTDEEIQLEADNGARTLKLDGVRISEGYLYCKALENGTDCIDFTEQSISRNEEAGFLLVLKSNEQSSLFFEIKTKFSKLR